jgi:transcriptional accessory protein Tex/SPT6
MNLLEAIARDLRRPEDQLRLPADLLRQGYDPSYLARVRPDELSQLDAPTLSRLRRALRYRDLLEQQKQAVRQSMVEQESWTESLEEAFGAADSKAQVNALTKFGSSRRGTKALAAANPLTEKLAAAILMYSGPTPADFREWVKSTVEVGDDQLDTLLSETKNYLHALLLEDSRLVSKIFAFIKQRAVLQSSELTNHADGEEPAGEKKNNKSRSKQKNKKGPEARTSPQATVAESVSSEAEDVSQTVAEEPIIAANTENADQPENIAAGEHAGESAQEQQSNEEIEVPSQTPAESSTVSTDESSTEQASDSLGAAVQAESPAVEIKNFDTNKKKTRAVSSKDLSPRQRRRRWLKFQLEPYYKLRRSLTKLSPFQVIMLGRGHRSQILKVELDYDRKAVARMARESLFQKDHPLSDFLNEVVDEAVNGSLTSRIEQEVFTAAEEHAQQELVEYAVEHLQHLLMQRPLRGHRIMMIDAIGTRTAAVVIVDPEGRIDHVGELPCDSSRPDVVNQNVKLLGEWAHQYNVSVLAVSTGPARRFVLPSIREFMNQCDPSTIRWTMVDRDGADTYCTTRLALKELPELSRRHRAAAWLAWRLQDPLVQLLKIDPTKLRLAVFQAELPPELVEESLREAVASSVATRGIDYWNGHSKAMACIPGLNNESAKMICDIRDSEGPNCREALMLAIGDKLSATKLRQSIGFLRIFGSPETLDGTLIHPDDYRIAQRLIANTELEAPPAAPPNWTQQKSTETREDQSTVVDSPTLDAGDEAVEEPTIEAQTGSSDETVIAEPDASNELVASDSVSEVDSTADEDVQAAAEQASDVPVDDASPETDSIETFASSATENTDLTQSHPPATFGGHELSAVAPDFSDKQAEEKTAAIDAEKLARMWQVGREKLKFVAQVLQHPFDDPRDLQSPIPLMKRVPKIEDLEVGSTMWAIVSGIADFGVFADLGPDCSGLIHVSRLSRNYVEDPRQVVNIGDLIQVWVQEVDATKRRISLTALPPGVVQQSRVTGDHPDTRHEYRGNRDGQRGGNRRDGDAHHRNDRGGHGNNRGAGGRPQSQGQSQAPRGAGDRPQRQGDNRQRQGGERGGASGRDSQRPADSRPKFGGQGGGRDRQRGDRHRGGRHGAPNIGAATVVDLPSKELPANARKGNASSSEQSESGKDTMRSFSDLLARFQVKHEESKQSPPEE